MFEVPTSVVSMDTLSQVILSAALAVRHIVFRQLIFLRAPEPKGFTRNSLVNFSLPLNY